MSDTRFEDVPDEDDEAFLRALWLSRLMFNEFVGFAPETRSFDEFAEDHRR